MIGTRVRAVPAVLLLVLLGLVVLGAWLDVGADDVELDNPAEGLSHISWVGSVADDGRLSVSVTYDFSDDVTHEMDIRVPDGARYLAVNGHPIAADIGKYATTQVSTRATVSYELPGAVRRYHDGALLQLAGLSDNSGDNPTIDGDQAMFPCPRCYIDDIGYGDAAVDGALYVDGARAVRLEFIELQSVRSAVDDDGSVVRFAGIDPAVDDVSMLAFLPRAAVPNARLGDGSVETALSSATEDLRRAERSVSSPSDPDDGGVVTPIVVTAIFAALLLWIILRLRWAAQVRRSASSDLESEPVLAPPSDLEPALAGAVVGEGGPGSRSVIAATLIELARRGAISIEGPDFRRVVVDVPSGATGETKFEQAVLAELRTSPDPVSAATREGPPLWHSDGPVVRRRLQIALAREARRQGLVAPTLAPTVLVLGSIALVVIAIVGGTGGSGLAWFMAFAGPVLGVIAAAMAGATLTRRGRRERDQWARYADHLREQTELAAADQNDITTCGAPLAYAAALGAAPQIATALSPVR